MLEVVTEYWRLLVGAQLHVIVGWGVLWAVLGGIGAAVAGLILFFVVRGRGWLATTWRFGRLVRVLVAIALTLNVGTGGAAVAGLEGALRATPDAVKASNFGQEGLTVIGNAVAAAYFTIHFLLLAIDPDTLEAREDTSALDAAIAETVPSLFVEFVGAADGVEEDGWELSGERDPSQPLLTQEAWLEVAKRGLVMDFELMRENASQLEESFLRSAVEPVKAEVLPVFPEAIAERIEPAIEWVLVGGLRKVLYDKVAESVDAKVPGLADLLADYADGLEDLAEQSGTETDVTFEELSTYTIDALILPVLMMPLRYVVRAQQVTFLVILLLVTVALLGAIPLTNAILRWRAKREGGDASGDAPDA